MSMKKSLFMNEALSNKIKILTFILSIFVIIIHSINIDTSEMGLNLISFFQVFISKGMCRIAVPTFFILSGYFLYRKHDYSLMYSIKSLKKRFNTLLIPYMIIISFTLFYYWCFQQIPLLAKYFHKDMIISDFNFWSFIKAYLFPMEHSPAQHLWFIRNLIIYVALSPLFYLFVRSTNIFIAAFIGNLLLRAYFLPGPEYLQLDGLSYFLLGMYLAVNKINLSNITLPKWGLISLGICYVILLTINSILYTDNYYNSYLLHFSAIVGIIFTWIIIDKIIDINDPKLLELANFSFFIYLIHIPFTFKISKILILILGTSPTSLLISYICTIIITIMTTLTAGIVLKNKLPKLYSIISGSR